MYMCFRIKSYFIHALQIDIFFICKQEPQNIVPTLNPRYLHKNMLDLASHIHVSLCRYTLNLSSHYNAETNYKGKVVISFPQTVS